MRATRWPPQIGCGCSSAPPGFSAVPRRQGVSAARPERAGRSTVIGRVGLHRARPRAPAGSPAEPGPSTPPRRHRTASVGHPSPNTGDGSTVMGRRWPRQSMPVRRRVKRSKARSGRPRAKSGGHRRRGRSDRHRAARNVIGRSRRCRMPRRPRASAVPVLFRGTAMRAASVVLQGRSRATDPPVVNEPEKHRTTRSALAEQVPLLRHPT